MKIVAIILILFLSLISCKKAEYSVKYAVTCGNCNITYQDRDGITKTVLNNYGNWEFNFAGIPGRFVTVSAQAVTNSSGQFEFAKATIYVANKEFRTARTTGTYNVATASGYLND